jgi:hypothetical protein
MRRVESNPLAASLVGYFLYVGTAFTAIMCLLLSLFVGSSVLESARHYPRFAIVQTVTASNEAYRRLLKKEANRQASKALAAKEASLPNGPEQPDVLFTAQADSDESDEQADTDKSKAEKRSYPHKSRRRLASRPNEPTARLPTALSYATEFSFAERRYGSLTGFGSASSAQATYH